MRVAQTNLQLVIQMNEAGYAPDDVRLVGDAYNVAARAYVVKYRATGKPLIAHVVGTASLLVSAGASASAVAAGILHAAPPDGDFGLRSWKSVVKSRVGFDVAAIVEAYDALQWDYTIGQVGDLLANVDDLGSVDREALIIRIANEIEDYIDDALIHYGFVTDPTVPKSAAYRKEYLLDTASAMAALATKLGVPHLADYIEDFREGLDAGLTDPTWPRLDPRSTAMFIIKPASYRLRPEVRLARAPRIIKKVRHKGARGSAIAALRRIRGMIP